MYFYETTMRLFWQFQVLLELPPPTDGRLHREFLGMLVECVSKVPVLTMLRGQVPRDARLHTR